MCSKNAIINLAVLKKILILKILRSKSRYPLLTGHHYNRLETHWCDDTISKLRTMSHSRKIEKVITYRH
jgi:hypothetical protein